MVWRALLLFAVAVNGLPHRQAAPSLKLLDAQKFPTARCNDGSQGGYYYEKASSATNATKWVIHLQGGGECTDKQSCEKRLSSALGSSKHFAATFAPYQLASSDPEQNPSLHDWHHVFVPYCSSDDHSGTVSTPTNDTWGLYFAGHLIVESIVKDLKATAGLDNAATVVLTGGSAGGIGTWISVDWLQSELTNTKVYGAPIAGFYAFSTQYTGYGSSRPPWPFTATDWPSYTKLWSSFVPAACAEAQGQDSSWCMLSNFSAPTVKAPMFVTEAQTDQVQLMYHDGLPAWAGYGQYNVTNAFLLEWKKNQTQQLHATLKPSDGWFNPACWIHTAFDAKAPIIGGKSFVNAFDDWFRGGSVRLMDDCGILCNTHCGY